MKHLHFFYPENDLALAAGVANYTGPAAAVALRLAGADLPLWYANSPSDAFITTGFDAARYERLQNMFGKLPEPVQAVSGGYAPAPWGWSAASRQLMALYGVEESFLPSDKAIERIRIVAPPHGSTNRTPACRLHAISRQSGCRDQRHRHTRKIPCRYTASSS